MFQQIINAEGEFDVQDIINVLRKNKEEHVKDYKIALEVYLGELLAKLSDIVLEIESAKIPETVNDNFGLLKPINEEKKYDDNIKLFSMHTSQKITLCLSEADKIFNDNWDWKNYAAAVNSSYSSKHR